MPKIPYTIIIPARYQSTRLPGKILADIGGLTLIERVYLQAKKTQAARIIVAVDDERIAEVMQFHGAEVVMTSPECCSGTERLADAILRLNLPSETPVINVQGDLPFVDPALIEKVADDLLTHPEADMVTIAVPMTNKTHFSLPQHVKVVTDAEGYALYFSRAGIPWQNTADDSQPLQNVFHHHGLYGYRAEYVKRYAKLSSSPLESLENLEQLRALWHGGRIHVAIVEYANLPEVNTAEDLDFVRKLVEENAS